MTRRARPTPRVSRRSSRTPPPPRGPTSRRTAWTRARSTNAEKRRSGFFARAAGVTAFDTSARAAAIAKPTVQVNPGRPIAILAYAHDGTDPCTGNANGVPYGITIEGNPQDTIDAVLSNGSVTMNSKGSLGWAGYGRPPSNCARAGSRQADLGGSHALTLVAPIVNIPPGAGNNNLVLTPFNAGLDAANKDLVLWQYGDDQSYDRTSGFPATPIR